MCTSFPKISKIAILNSQFSYAISVWGGLANDNKSKQLFYLQKIALRNLFCVCSVSSILVVTQKVFFMTKIFGQFPIFIIMC